MNHGISFFIYALATTMVKHTFKPVTRKRKYFRIKIIYMIHYLFAYTRIKLFYFLEKIT